MRPRFLAELCGITVAYALNVEPEKKLEPWPDSRL